MICRVCGDKCMCVIIIMLGLLAAAIGTFIWIMRHEPRTLWSGAALLGLLFCAALTIVFMFYEYADWLAERHLLMQILVGLLIMLAFGVLVFPAVLIGTLLVEGIRLIRRESFKPTNLLTLALAVLLYLYLVVWPLLGGLADGAVGTKIYLLVSFCAAYLLGLLAVYLLSAALNLFHLPKTLQAGYDYIVVLGAGLRGDKVTPLLAARIDRAIELLNKNPEAVLVMSGGQGPGEELSEGEAMAGYAERQGVESSRILIENESHSTEENLLFSRKLMTKERPKVIIVTTSYHVFRALLLAKRQGLSCLGVGAKTKWYFTLNALLREFVGYLSVSWQMHAVAAVFLGLLVWLSAL